MKINVDQKLLNFEGRPEKKINEYVVLNESGELVTDNNGTALVYKKEDEENFIKLKDVCVDALSIKKDGNNGSDIFKKMEIAERIYKAKKTVELTNEEINKIIKRLPDLKHYSDLILGRAYQILNDVKKYND